MHNIFTLTNFKCKCFAGRWRGWLPWHLWIRTRYVTICVFSKSILFSNANCNYRQHHSKLRRFYRDNFTNINDDAEHLFHKFYNGKHQPHTGTKFYSKYNPIADPKFCSTTNSLINYWSHPVVISIIDRVYHVPKRNLGPDVWMYEL